MATTDDVAAQVTHVAEKLAAHERIQEDRYEHLAKGIEDIKSAERAEGKTMSEVRIDATNPAGAMWPMLMGGNWGGGGTGAAVGGGLGAGLLGGILGGGLANGNGLFGNNRNNEGVVTPAELTAALNGVTSTTNTNAILQGIGDLKTAVPVAEGQVQLALQAAQSDLNRNIDGTGDQITAQISAAQLNNANNFAAQSRQISDILAASIANQNSIRSDLNAGVASINAGIANLATAQLQNTYALNTAIRDDGEKTRAMLVAQNEANLQRQLTVAESALAEQRATQRSRDVEVNVTQTVTQNQTQLQLQAQQQQQLILLSQIAAGLNGLQNATAANTQIIAGNRGYTQGGAQSAVPTNVMA